jgi:hypothetical protein
MKAGAVAVRGRNMLQKYDIVLHVPWIREGCSSNRATEGHLLPPTLEVSSLNSGPRVSSGSRSQCQLPTLFIKLHILRSSAAKVPSEVYHWTVGYTFSHVQGHNFIRSIAVNVLIWFSFCVRRMRFIVFSCCVFYLFVIYLTMLRVP